MTVDTKARAGAAASANPFQPPKASLEVHAVGEDEAFFAVGTTKLWIMGLTTLGIYELYWFYKQWKCAARVSNENLWAWARALFFPFTAYSLFKRMQAHGAKHEVQLTGIGGLAALVFVLNIAWRLPDPWWLVSLFAFVPLVTVQKAVNAINARVAPDADENRRLTAGNIVAVLFGGAITALAVLGTLMPQAGGQ